jgi:hypothetical protein
MNKDDLPRPHPAQNGGTTPAVAANAQWHNAELASKMARHSYDRWLITSGEDTRSPAIMHAYHTHESLHEAARAITTLIETFRAQAAALITTPAPGIDIPRSTPVTRIPST